MSWALGDKLGGMLGDIFKVIRSPCVDFQSPTCPPPIRSFRYFVDIVNLRRY